MDINQGLYNKQWAQYARGGELVVIYEWTAAAKLERIISFWVTKQALEDALVAH